MRVCVCAYMGTRACVQNCKKKAWCLAFLWKASSPTYPNADIYWTPSCHLFRVKRVTHPLSPLHETSDYVVCTSCYFYNHSVLLLGVLFGLFVCLFFKQYNIKSCQSECILIEDTPPASPASQKILKREQERAYLVRKYWGYKCKTS